MDWIKDAEEDMRQWEDELASLGKRAGNKMQEYESDARSMYQRGKRKAQEDMDKIEQETDR